MHAVFVSLYSKVTLVVVCLDVVSPPPRSLRLLYLTVGWSEVIIIILLEEIWVGWTSSCCPDRYQRITIGVSQHGFSGHFNRCSSTPIHYPALT